MNRGPPCGQVSKIKLLDRVLNAAVAPYDVDVIVDAASASVPSILLQLWQTFMLPSVTAKIIPKHTFFIEAADKIDESILIIGETRPVNLIAHCLSCLRTAGQRLAISRQQSTKGAPILDLKDLIWGYLRTEPVSAVQLK